MNADLFGQIIVSPGIGGSVETGSCGIAVVDRPSRGWESAQTDRLNEAHWQTVGSDDINEDLQLDIDTLRARSRHETQNNSLVEGAIETQTTNVAGKNGPSLQVSSDNKKYNDSVEEKWSNWIKNCEFQEGLGLVDMMPSWVNQWSYAGELLIQELIGEGPNDYKLNDLGPESFDTGKYGDNIIGGVELNRRGQVVAYHVKDDSVAGYSRRLPAETTIHVYRRKYARQRRGIGQMYSGLQDMADLRDYDVQVLDAAREAADRSIWMVSNHPDAPFYDYKEGELPVKRRTRRMAPAGWKPIAVAGTQPMPNYDTYRNEKQTDVGAAFEMPWMILRRNAANHNMSSARFDGARYANAVARFQGFLERRILERLLKRVIQLNTLTGELGRAPKYVEYSWTWPVPPAVDVAKEALARRLRMEDGTLSYSDALAEAGFRLDETIAKRVRDNELLVEAGLAPIAGPLPMPILDYLNAIAVLDGKEPKLPDQGNSNSQPGGKSNGKAAKNKS